MRNSINDVTITGLFRAVPKLWILRAWGEPIIAENMAAANVEKCFEQARAQAAKGNLVIVRADGRHLLLPALTKDSVNPQMIASVERIIPSTTKRNVAVIADTAWAEQASPSIQAANQAIPFFGMLMGFTLIGHSVWVFNGAANVLSSGCQGADLLIVDSASLANLASKWQRIAQPAMRNPQIVVHDRATYKLRSLS
jgi:hypothetical protein